MIRVLLADDEAMIRAGVRAILTDLELGGKANEGIGKATDDKQLEAEGKTDQSKSNLKTVVTQSWWGLMWVPATMREMPAVVRPGAWFSAFSVRGQVAHASSIRVPNATSP